MVSNLYIRICQVRSKDARKEGWATKLEHIFHAFMCAIDHFASITNICPNNAITKTKEVLNLE